MCSFGAEKGGVLRRWPGRVMRALCRERRCLVCASVFRDQGAGAVLCRACAEAMPRRSRGFCPHCGEPAAWPELPPAACAHCLKETPPWGVFFFHGLHEGLLRDLAVGLKFRNHLLFGHVLGLLLAAHPGFSALEATAVVPVPLHASRLAARGYNQAQEIARPLAARLRLPLLPDALRRVRATAPQTGASRAERERNILNAFAAGQAVAGAHVLLVDDTLTTGATLAEAARALLRRGAAGVSAAVASRTPLHYRRHGRPGPEPAN